MNLFQNRIYTLNSEAIKVGRLVKNKYGNFKDSSNFFAVPYRHHKNREVWNVCVGIGDRFEYINAIAEDAIDASAHALQAFKLKLLAEEAAEDEKEEREN